MDDINDDFVTTLKTLQINLTINKTIHRSCKTIDFNELVNIPNPKTNSIEIKQIEFENIKLPKNNFTNIPTLAKPLKIVKKIFNFPKPKSIDNQILQQYFQIWRRKANYAKNQRKLKEIEEQHQTKITNFLQVLQKRKASIEVESKNKVTKIRSAQKFRPKRIKNRKSTSAPSIQPNKSIEIAQLQTEINQSLKETKDQIRALTLPKLPSCYIKNITPEGKVKFVPKVPETIVKSIAMAKNREERHKYLLAKREAAKEERKRIAEETFKNKQLSELEERKRYFKEMREKKKQEQEISQQLTIEKLRYLENLQRAKLFFKFKVKFKYFLVWKKYVYNLQAKMVWGLQFYQVNTLQRCFKLWKWEIRKRVLDRNKKADDFRRKCLLRNGMKSWKSVSIRGVKAKLIEL